MREDLKLKMAQNLLHRSVGYMYCILSTSLEDYCYLPVTTHFEDFIDIVSAYMRLINYVLSSKSLITIQLPFLLLADKIFFLFVWILDLSLASSGPVGGGAAEGYKAYYKNRFRLLFCLLHKQFHVLTGSDII